MSAADGSVVGPVKIVDHGPDNQRWVLAILAEGYQSGELATFASDALNLANALATVPPYDAMWPAVNVYRVDVSSTDSGAADPVGCMGTGATPHTYFDSTFCGGGPGTTPADNRRILTVNTALALSVATTNVPTVKVTLVLVNSPIYGGSGGAVATASTNPNSLQIAVHEIGHTYFALADEYADPGNGVGGDNYTGGEAGIAALGVGTVNVTTITDAATIPWKDLLTPGVKMPTTSNADCSQVDPQASPVPVGTVGAFEGAKYFHCGLYRPEYDCRMRSVTMPGTPPPAFCHVCSGVIVADLKPFMPGPPVIAGFSPASGNSGGGAIVVITGSGFFGATAVNFGANSAVTFNADSDTQITALSPAGTGAVLISVVTPVGNTTSGAASFSYTAPAPAPQIAVVSPATGVTSGGTTVVITGSGFTGVTAVAFGATQAAGFNVDSDAQITATSPASPAGTVDISLTGPAGTSSAVLADRFLFAVPAPVVTGISPASGPAAGGTSVTLTGAAFTGATNVSFGATGATFTVASDTSITATSPAGTGVQDVLVTTSSGTSAAVAADQFTYSAALPVVTSINPQSGSQLGGDSVILTGAGFSGTTSVSFGAVPASPVTVNSDTQISVTSPAGTGTVDITVTTPAGTSAAGAADQFTYAAPSAPVVTGLSPNSGAGAGGDSVVITGTGFTGATAVNFGSNAATNVTVDSDTQITATSPSGGGAVDVTVTAPGGTSAAAPADQFTYNSLGLPSVTAVSPSIGSSGGGDQVTVRGIGFTNATTVAFGPNSAFFSVDSDVQITVTTPAGTGTVDVTVTTPAGTSAVNTADQFVYT